MARGEAGGKKRSKGIRRKGKEAGLKWSFPLSSINTAIYWVRYTCIGFCAHATVSWFCKKAFTRDSTQCLARISYRNSVCLSVSLPVRPPVCLSRPGNDSSPG